MQELGLVEITFLGAGLASVGLWCWLLARRGRLREVLPYEPRQRVPWGVAGVWPAVLMVVLAVAAASIPSSSELKEGLTRETYINAALTDSAVKLMLLAFLAAAIVVGLSATGKDFGLPSSGGELVRDVFLGFLTALACLAPVYAVQMFLVNVFDWPPHHPTIERILADPDWQVMGVSFLAAVVVAPLFEEFAFRLLLQGCLEKMEDEHLPWRATERRLPDSPKSLEHEGVADEGSPSGNPYAPPQTKPTHELQGASQEFDPAGDATDPEDRLALRLLPGLPHGWGPILASSFLFSLAHFTHGPAPVSLFVLAVMLGYVYQRTHRIVPCVVAHATFNALSLLAVGLTAQ